jgi:hypothetical protein
MRPLSIEWHELMVTAAIFVATMLAFASLSSTAGWPNAANGWPLAVGVALVLALLRVIGPVLDLRQAGAKLETPFIKLDFAGTARVVGATGQPWILSDDLIRKSPSVPDSALPELERSVTLLHGSREQRSSPLSLRFLRDADGFWASKLQHPVQDADSNGNLGGLPAVRVRSQRVADHPLVAADVRLYQRPSIIAGRLLPGHATPLGNELGLWAQTLRISRAVENQSIRRFWLSVAVLNPSRNR